MTDIEPLILHRDNIYGRKTETRKIFGREFELQKLLAILKGKYGATILLAGDRGSGKTTLIEESISKVKADWSNDNLRFINKYTFKRDIVINVPLIQMGDNPEAIRGKVLRAIIYALDVENDFKSMVRRPFSYSYRLMRLMKLVNYTKVTKESSFSLGANFGEKSGNTGVSKVLNSELDLSDMRIEMKLSSFFKKITKTMRIIVIFDELDKFEEKISPDEYIQYLKNLFTNKGAKFIFVTTENFYQKIEEEERQKSKDIAYTLYTHRILINQLQPDDFRKLLNHYIKNHEMLKSQQIYQDLIQKLMIKTDLYPFELHKVITRLESGDKKESQVNWRTVGNEINVSSDDVLRHFVLEQIYNEFKYDRDGYFNRYLYKTLREIMNYIESYTSFEVPRSGLINYILWNERFNTSNGLEEYLEKYTSRSKAPNLMNDSWKIRVYELPAHERAIIEKSCLEFVSRLDYIDSANVLKSDDLPLSPLSKVRLTSSPFGVSNYDEARKRLKAYKNYDKKPQNIEEIKERATLLAKRYFNLPGAKLDPMFDKLNTITSKYTIDDSVKLPFTIRSKQYRFGSDIATDRVLLDDIERVLVDTLLIKVRSAIASNQRLNSKISNNQILISNHSQRMKVLIVVDGSPKDLQILVSDYTKVISIITSKKIQMSKFKNIKTFKLSKEWENINRVVDEMQLILK